MDRNKQTSNMTTMQCLPTAKFGVLHPLRSTADDDDNVKNPFVLSLSSSSKQFVVSDNEKKHTTTSFSSDPCRVTYNVQKYDRLAVELSSMVSSSESMAARVDPLSGGFVVETTSEDTLVDDIVASSSSSQVSLVPNDNAWMTMMPACIVHRDHATTTSARYPIRSTHRFTVLEQSERTCEVYSSSSSSTGHAKMRAVVVGESKECSGTVKPKFPSTIPVPNHDATDQNLYLSLDRLAVPLRIMHSSPSSKMRITEDSQIVETDHSQQQQRNVPPTQMNTDVARKETEPPSLTPAVAPTVQRQQDENDTTGQYFNKISSRSSSIRKTIIWNMDMTAEYTIPFQRRYPVIPTAVFSVLDANSSSSSVVGVTRNSIIDTPSKRETTTQPLFPAKSSVSHQPSATTAASLLSCVDARSLEMKMIVLKNGDDTADHHIRTTTFTTTPCCNEDDDEDETKQNVHDEATTCEINTMHTHNYKAVVEEASESTFTDTIKKEEDMAKFELVSTNAKASHMDDIFKVTAESITIYNEMISTSASRVLADAKKEGNSTASQFDREMVQAPEEIYTAQVQPGDDNPTINNHNFKEIIAEDIGCVNIPTAATTMTTTETQGSGNSIATNNSVLFGDENVVTSEDISDLEHNHKNVNSKNDDDNKVFTAPREISVFENNTAALTPTNKYKNQVTTENTSSPSKATKSNNHASRSKGTLPMQSTVPPKPRTPGPFANSPEITASTASRDVNVRSITAETSSPKNHEEVVATTPGAVHASRSPPSKNADTTNALTTTACTAGKTVQLSQPSISYASVAKTCVLPQPANDSPYKKRSREADEKSSIKTKSPAINNNDKNPAEEDSQTALNDNNNKLLILISNQSLTRNVTANQKLVFVILKSLGIEYTTVDGADPIHKARRNELFEISGLRGEYPQFFLTNGGNFQFWGNMERFEQCNEIGALTMELCSGNCAPLGSVCKDECRESVPSVEEEMQRLTLIALVSPQSSSPEATEKQEKIFAALQEKEIPIETVDSSISDNHETVENLYKISGIFNQYPQFFVAQNGDLSYLGDDKSFEMQLNNGALKKIRGVKSHEPWISVPIRGTTGQMPAPLPDVKQLVLSGKKPQHRKNAKKSSPSKTKNKTVSTAGESTAALSRTVNTTTTTSRQSNVDQPVNPTQNSATGREESTTSSGERVGLASGETVGTQVVDDRTTETEITVYGATSFVAKHAFDYFMQVSLSIPGKRTITLAGRNERKLKALRDTLSEKMGNLQIINSESVGSCLFDVWVADSSDVPKLTKMAERTKIIANFAGPFTKYGEHVVAACARTGTDYIDITGEFSWSSTMRLRYGDVAAKSGARIISFCGFDSIPSDLAIFAAVEALKTKTGRYNVDIRDASTWHHVIGSFNGGTIHTIMGFPISLRKCLAWPVPFFLDDPLALADPLFRVDEKNRPLKNRMALTEWLNQLPSFDSILQYGASGPFLMAATNAKVVNVSAVALKYGTSFAYRERFLPAGFKGTIKLGLVSIVATLIAQAGVLLLGLVLKTPIIGKVLADWLAPPGSGPTDHVCKQGLSEVYAEVTSATLPSGLVNRGNCFMKFFGDPGNW
jgi:hypothetical protein